MWHGQAVGGWGWAWMTTGMLMMLLFWGAVIALVVWAVRTVGGDAGARERSPLEIAKARYARGEITKEQFDVLRRDLG